MGYFNCLKITSKFDTQIIYFFAQIAHFLLSKAVFQKINAVSAETNDKNDHRRQYRCQYQRYYNRGKLLINLSKMSHPVIFPIQLKYIHK